MQLNLTNISYTYPGAVSPAVRDVGVTFSSGWTAVIGDNGCGKSTLARIATRLIEPDSGTVGSSCSPCTASRILRSNLGTS